MTQMTQTTTDNKATTTNESADVVDFTALGGSAVHQYQIGDCLGQGGMGIVYRAEDTKLNRPVALKFPTDAVRKDETQRNLLLREARAASALNSPNIVSIYEVGEFEGAPFLAMEHVEGTRLSDRIENGPLGLDETLDIVIQVASALENAHAAGVIHRDIKSSNLLITEAGVVKVLDFGIAKFMHQDTPTPEAATSTITVTGNIFGTLSYMSPEQALGKLVDHRSDLFSLGVVFYQTLTGQLPFAGENLNEVVDHIVHREPAAVARFNYEVSQDVEAVLRKLLEKDPNLRYQSARDVQIDLQRLKRDRSPQPGEGVTDPAQTTQPASLRSGNPALSRRRAVVLDFRNVTGTAEDDTIGVSLTETVLADLNSALGLEVVGREAVSEVRRLGVAIDQAEAGNDTTALEVARRVGAGWLITGAYQQLGDRMRVTAKLIDAHEGTIVQTVKIDGTAEQIFDLQDRIVPELTSELGDLKETPKSGEPAGRDELDAMPTHMPGDQ